MWFLDSPLYQPPDYQPFPIGSGDVFGFMTASLVMMLALCAGLFWLLLSLGAVAAERSPKSGGGVLLLAFLGAPLGTGAIFYEFWTPWLHDAAVAAGEAISVIVFSLAGIAILVAIGAAFVIPFLRNETRSGGGDDLGCTFIVLLAISTGALDMFTGLGFWMSLLAGIATAIAYVVLASFLADSIRGRRRRR